VQWVSTRLLTALWRIGGKTDVRSSFAGIERFGLWESPTGLYFFDPPREGDNLFYSRFYAWLKSRRLFDTETLREEFFMTAARIPPDARLLDVGSGRGAFRQCVPQANYTGLDPHFSESAIAPGVRNETLARHLVENEARYDAVCSFHVIEHVSDPKALFGEIMRAVKPGGLVCVSAPHVPSATTRIPNFLINAPPHHLTWWTKNALIELAKSAGAVVESVEKVPWGKAESLAYWMARCSPLKCADIYYRGRMKWYLAMGVSFVFGTLAFRLLGRPRKMNDEGAALLLFARRPAGAESA
jgi:2-polyprenyl-3-methyl-5-hydroxy-6-metoxy-1,4-benzoquinol methylase